MQIIKSIIGFYLFTILFCLGVGYLFGSYITITSKPHTITRAISSFIPDVFSSDGNTSKYYNFEIK